MATTKLFKGDSAFPRFGKYYYRKFIAGFSTLVAPITALTKKGADPSSWPLEASRAFESLKKAFVSAPTLRHPVPTLSFTLVVDASDVEAGAVLSQRITPEDKLHPFGFFSKKKSSAERNYDVGNRDLLAIKMALQQWNQGTHSDPDRPQKSFLH